MVLALEREKPVGERGADTEHRLSDGSSSDACEPSDDDTAQGEVVGIIKRAERAIAAFMLSDGSSEKSSADVMMQQGMRRPSSGLHAHDLPWSPRLLCASTSQARLLTRMDPAQREAVCCPADVRTEAVDGGGSPPTKSLPRSVRRMREAEDSRQLRWEHRRAQLEHDRALEVEATMRAFATVHYTGAAVAQMGSHFAADAGCGQTARAMATDERSMPGRPHTSPSRTLYDVSTVSTATLATADAHATQRLWADDRVSGTGRLAVRAVGSKSPSSCLAKSPLANQSAAIGRGTAIVQRRRDTTLRPTTSLPVL